MQVQELATNAADAIARREERIAKGMPDFGPAKLTLVIPGRARGLIRRIAGPGSPKGEVLTDHIDAEGKPSAVVAVSAIEVLAWLTAKGLVKVELTPPTTPKGA